jgi:hypothetical protein
VRSNPSASCPVGRRPAADVIRHRVRAAFRVVRTGALQRATSLRASACHLETVRPVRAERSVPRVRGEPDG